ncbi:MAG: serine/threonine-protein kinase [Acidobacteria bacterium]|nr:serine/threonine-protein kinase [Acidobacteriota bacterium]
MDVERLQNIEEIFHAAADLEPDEREAFLDARCGGDADLRREVVSLLAADSGVDSLIDSSPKSLVRDAFSAQAAESDDAESVIGSEIDQYRIVSLIGEGGMGKVYLARDGQLERNVAVKFLSERFASDRLRRERFFREAKSASALNHPNILTVHEIGEFRNTFFIVTEFVRGETLKDRLKSETPPIGTAIDIATQIASALAAAHEAGIVHRDIKPDNVMIREDRLVKVLDFGIAKLDPAIAGATDSEAETRVEAATTPGMIIGTPQYMSPEQARGQRVDARSDIFSFGVVLFEMLTGKAPFKGTTNIDTIGSILKDEPEAISTLVPEVSRDLERIVEKALRKDRDQRYQHIKDVMIDLGDVRKTLETEGSVRPGTLVEVPRVTSDELRAPASRKLMFALLAAIVIASVAFGVYWFRPRNSVAVSDLRTVEVANWSSTPGEIYSVGSLSPDAKTLAFSSSRNGSMNIWVKQTATGEAVQITKDDANNKSPVWSPNGEELAFFATKDGQPAIWRIPKLGGSPKQIAELTDRATQIRLWSDSEVIYFEASGELFSARADSGVIEKLTDFASRGIKPRSVHIARDGKTIAYTTSEDKKSVIWSTNVSGRSPTRIFESENQIKNLAWHADSDRLFFSSTVDGTFQIFVTDTSGAKPTQLTNAENDCLVLDASGDGTKVLFGTAKEESDVWSVSLNDKKESGIANNIDSELWPDVSPDGRSVAYQSIKNLSQGNKIFDGSLFVRAIDGPQAETRIVEKGFLPKFSPDGKLIAFLVLDGDKISLETIKASGGERKRIATGVTTISYSVLPYNRVQASDFSWSPDGRWLAYISDEGGGSLRIASADGSQQKVIAPAGEGIFLFSPIWSSDGKRIAYTSRTSNMEGRPTLGLLIANVEDVSAEPKVTDPIWTGNSFIRLVGWTAGDKELIIASVARGALNASATGVALSQIESSTGNLTETVNLEETYLHNIHLSNDRKTIAFSAHRDGRDNIWTMAATGGEAKQVTGNNDSRLYFSSLAWAPDGTRIYFGRQSRFSLLSMLTNFK